MITSLSVDKMMLLRYMNWSTNFRDLPLNVERAACLKFMNSILSVFIYRPLLAAGYAVGFSLAEVLDHLHSLYLS